MSFSFLLSESLTLFYVCEMHEAADAQQLCGGNSWWVRLLDKSHVALAC